MIVICRSEVFIHEITMEDKSICYSIIWEIGDDSLRSQIRGLTGENIGIRRPTSLKTCSNGKYSSLSNVTSSKQPKIRIEIS